MIRIYKLQFWLAGMLAAVVSASGGEARVDFNRDIRPILSQNCFLCHGPDEQERKGKLRLDLREEAMRPASSGARAIVPGHPEQSELIARVVHSDPDEAMPPAKSNKRLSPAEIELLKTWIQEGARYAMHWAYTTPERPPLPRVSNPDWVRNGLDYFILERLDREGLKPQPEADKRTLIRRVHLDLTGLPPAPHEVNQFLNDEGSGAYERMVDRALQKQSFGEHWAALWLDLARYADSAGYADDPLRSIWGYRDYVINSFNNNKPFDRFTVEQIAGDLLPEPSEEQLVATAFHRNTMTNNEGGTNDEEFRNAAVVDRVNTTMAVWMGTSMACAQCHTHKYDPITQEEYFRFMAILDNTEDADRGDESPTLPIYTKPQKMQRAKLEMEIAGLEEILQQSTPETDQSFAEWAGGFPKGIAWKTLEPGSILLESQLSSRSDKGVIKVRPDRKGVYTAEIPFEGGLTAIQLETIADGGASEADKFVVSKISARLVPPGKKMIPGRFVRIELPGKDKILSLAEVQIFSGTDNIASKGEARQSSTEYGAEAGLAIDSNTDGNFDSKSTTHSSKSENPWWEVDLKEAREIERIVVWNRTDNNLQERLNGFKVSVLNEKRETIWEQAVSEAPKTSHEMTLDGTREVQFAGAFADAEQEELPAAAVLAQKADKKKGWGGSAAQDHWLKLVANTTYEAAAGSKLVVRLEQNSELATVALASFRISAAHAPALPHYAKLPSSVLGALDRPLRDNRQEEELKKYYLRNLAPQLKAEREQVAALQKQLQEIKPATVPIMRELAAEKRRQTRFQFRGNFQDVGPVVTEGVPEVFHALPEASAQRLALALWLVDRKNPLTARVAANRFWEQIFGIGLVRTSEEFGSQGDLPSHPELLDWLAVEFMDQGWDTKRFLKLLVTSSTYRQSSEVTPDLFERDPDNRLLARGPRFRVSAEVVRDQALFVAGLLSAKVGGPSVKPPRPASGLTAAFGGSVDWKTSEGEDKYRRALYTEVRRTAPYPSMATFDAPNREVCTVRRTRTNTPLQALVTLNDPVYLEAAQGLARRMEAGGSSVREQIRFGFEAALIRSPKDEELERLVALYEEVREEFSVKPEDALRIATEPLGPLPNGKDAAQMAALTTVASVVLNLDEIVLKP